MFLSSIFNFESLRGFRPRAPATLLAVIGVIASIEIFARLLPEERLLRANNIFGEVAFIEHDILPKFPDPRVVLLGSSRMRRAVVPKQLDEALGMPIGSTINL